VLWRDDHPGWDFDGTIGEDSARDRVAEVGVFDDIGLLRPWFSRFEESFGCHFQGCDVVESRGFRSVKMRLETGQLPEGCLCIELEVIKMENTEVGTKHREPRPFREVLWCDVMRTCCATAKKEIVKR
jgi:hypothetical protein